MTQVLIGIAIAGLFIVSYMQYKEIRKNEPKPIKIKKPKNGNNKTS